MVLKKYWRSSVMVVALLASGLLISGCAMLDPNADAKKVFEEFKKAEIEVENIV